MANTTNYNWETPDDTDLVKDGALAIRTLGSAVDTTVFNNAAAAIAKSIVDAKGDIIAATAADTVSRLAVGANDTVLTADSSTATGLKWTAPAGGGKVLQVVSAAITTTTAITATSMTDTSITLAITPTLATSKVLVIISAVTEITGSADGVISGAQLLRGATQIADYGSTNRTEWQHIYAPPATTVTLRNIQAAVYLDSPATTSSTTYKLQAGLNSSASGRTVTFQRNGHPSTITLLEIGA